MGFAVAGKVQESTLQRTRCQHAQVYGLRVNIVLNKKKDPMHDTTNIGSCDCGVRFWFVVPRFF